MNVTCPTVFVVEDDPQMRESFAALFTSHGLAVEVFSCGEDFIGRYDPSSPGCIVADFRLQGINGIDLHRLLLQSGCSLPLILISGYLNVRSAIEAVRQGIYRVLEKPYREDELLSAVQDAVHENRKSREKNVYRMDFAHRLRQLDARERLALEMIVDGQGNRAIERRLGLSTRTVDRIRSSILEKTGCFSFVELSAAYGAARATGQASAHVPAGDVSCEPGETEPAQATVDCLRTGLERVQTLLSGDGKIDEDSRPLLRDAEIALSKALNQVRHTQGLTRVSR
ncbi:MAG: response regulator transcription factor [Thermoguttaceae bacterium]